MFSQKRNSMPFYMLKHQICWYVMDGIIIERVFLESIQTAAIGCVNVNAAVERMQPVLS
jgi:hypothetical protein